MIERSDVCATSCAALNQFWILITDATGSFTRKYATASTATVTLSLVITCCDATGTAWVWRLTFRILSRNGRMKNKPGPFAPTHRPRRKITPRSYSCTMRKPSHEHKKKNDEDDCTGDSNCHRDLR